MSLHDTPVSSLGLVDENCVTAGEPEDMIFTTEQVASFDTKVIRRLAAAAESDEIHGKSTKLLMQAYFKGQYTLNDFAE